MKKKIIIIGSIVLVVIIILITILILNNHSTFSLDNKKDGSIVVNLKNADNKAGGVGYITLKKDQKLDVTTELKDKSKVKMEVLPYDDKDGVQEILSNEALLEKDLKGEKNQEYKLDAGEYVIRITAEKGATGKINIKAE